MSGDLLIMARNGTTLLPSELQRLAAMCDQWRADRLALEAEVHTLRAEAHRLAHELTDALRELTHAERAIAEGEAIANLQEDA